MDEFFQGLLERDLADLRGLTAEISLPLSQHLINEVIGIALRENRKIDSCDVAIHPHNRVSVNARVKTPLLPLSLHLKLMLDTSVDLASYSSPKLRAWLENHRLLGSLGSMFHALPEGIQLYGDQVVVDLAAFLRTPEQRKYLSWVKSADLRTEEGKILLDLRLQVD